MGADRRGRLPPYLCASYALLILYVCLFPLAGWQTPVGSPFSFLFEPWQKYISYSDVYLNVLGYLPLGFMLAATLRGQHAVAVLAWVTLVSFTLSFSVECLQYYLPSRISSNLDLATNVLGGVLGGMAGLWGGRVFAPDGWIRRWRERYIQPGHLGELGLILIALWWLTQLEPRSPLFGTGDLRFLFDLPAPVAFSARRYMLLELAVAAFGTVSVGLLVLRCMCLRRFHVVVLVLLAGLGLRSLAGALFLVPPDALQWAGSGAWRGLLIGLAALAVVSRLPRWSQHSLASLTLLCATALMNLMPDNPFIDASVRTLQQGHFLSFHGLTRLTVAVWPFLALVFLSAQATLSRR
ncbi:MAG: hypothetical protein CGU28_11165 [Candidatus Dactylopiibacterium carminicum]|uniref:VanZ-like domain-containing protein n=1 Tax=Candidatus Dactylopiibacterium carminicum TaxID=857335 RepID=A0A272ET20_9RHOO|nr:VanZ family protein [Candidatus Dactylopiibacterium carminicum]KAF7600755.1 hypothetical protein BGI27_01275 [Candidatus Dactylopiibacterium carminicum]PAS93176.1 MAG: hypothetical protein CGU29_08585 [Candidatus Dactylopiibacterium carminicum]PAS95865.1 MAG: hypothetical protein CGU28_11165 [Candidatus Dactylopiibacterium carminicum]PAT00762.1 MAG: hypothetical protein BSR46_01290 [Candidatus Dactylopiibacterium carminicum]